MSARWLWLLGLPACHGGGDGTVAINELLAANATGLTDEAGEFEDWVELFNGDRDAVDVSGWTLTDGPDLDVPWPIPDGTVLEAGDYLVITCDGTPDQGPLHADFKLSRNGETLVLARPDASVVDEVAYPVQPVDDVGWARTPDGGVDWVPAEPPTPGGPNP